MEGTFDGLPSNGLAFSCRARWEQPSKSQRSRARSGQLQCRVGRGRRLDPFPLRYVEACAASLNKPPHAACATTPQASTQAPQAATPCVKQPSDAACATTPQASAMWSGLPADEASTSTPQASEKAPQAAAARLKRPTDEACATAPQAVAARANEPTDEAWATSRNRAFLDTTLPRLPAQRRSSAAACRPTPTPRVSDWDHFHHAKKPRSRAPAGGWLQRDVRRSGIPRSSASRIRRPHRHRITRSITGLQR